MTYVYETTMGGKHLVVEYCFSSVSDSIKVVDMTADGKFHRLNWMSDAGRDKLMTALDKDMEDRMCGLWMTLVLVEILWIQRWTWIEICQGLKVRWMNLTI